MSASPNNEPQESEEARTISDNMIAPRPASTPTAPQPVVFRAIPNTALEQIPAKKERKGTLKKTKQRSSTPRPLLKNGGRKRFSISPSSELKQAFKRSAHIDLADDRGREHRNKRNLLADLTEVADIINLPPAVVCLKSENGSAKGLECRELDTRSVLGLGRSSSFEVVEGLPDAGMVTGDVEADGREVGTTLYVHWPKKNESPNSNGVLVGDLVN